MAMSLMFWIIMLIVLLFWGWTNRSPDGKYNFVGFGGWFVLWLLLALLGWKVFGAPISG